MAPRLETKRLVLRPWEDTDVPHWIELGADSRVMEFLTSTYERPQAEMMANVLRQNLDQNDYGWWVVEVKGGPSFVGVVALQDVPFDAHFTPALEIGWRLVPNAWHHGFATEGARAALDYALTSLGREEVVAMTARLNVRSQRVMQRLGMTHDERDDFEHPRLEDGHPLRPHVLYRAKRPA